MKKSKKKKWKTVVDFTKIRKGGIELRKILSKIQSLEVEGRKSNVYK